MDGAYSSSRRYGRANTIEHVRHLDVLGAVCTIRNVTLVEPILMPGPAL